MFVIVHARPHTTVTFPKAYADVFEPHILTITRCQDGLSLATFAPSDWQTVDVYDDETGYSVCSFTNHLGGRES
jgi:hypothetical protein